MIRVGLSLLLAMTVTVAFAAPQRRETPKPAPSKPARRLTEHQIAQIAIGALVYVEAGQNYGTGFFIDSGDLIVTCDHIVRSGGPIRISSVIAGSSWHGAEVAKASQSLDLALLTATDSFRVRGLKIVQKPPAIGERIYVASNPRGFAGTFVAGNISGYRAMGDGSRLMQISAPISRGSSGGAVLNSRAEVVGVVVASQRDAQNLNFAVGSDAISLVLGLFWDGLIPLSPDEVDAEVAKQRLAKLSKPKPLPRPAIIPEDPKAQVEILDLVESPIGFWELVDALQRAGFKRDAPKDLSSVPIAFAQMAGAPDGFARLVIELEQVGFTRNRRVALRDVSTVDLPGIVASQGGFAKLTTALRRAGFKHGN